MPVTRWTAKVALAALVTAALAGCGSSPARRSGAPEPAPAAAQLDAARTSALMVFDAYEKAGTAKRVSGGKKADPNAVAPYFADAATRARFEGGGGADAPLACGAGAGGAVVDGAVVGTPTGSAKALRVPVSLYAGSREAAQVTVTADARGRLTDFACGKPTAPGLPGIGALVGYYGGVASATGTPGADDAVKALKQRYLSPAFAGFTRPDVDADQSTCAEDAMPYWHAVYAPNATRTGAQWYFWSGGPGQVVMSVAVDAPSAKVAWVYCFGQLVPPLAPAAYSDTQVQSYVGDLFNSYSYLLAIKPFGADTSGMAGYFASPDAYRSAVAGTGAAPLECAPSPAGSIDADDAKLTGTTAVVDLSSSPAGHPVGPGQKPLGHPKVTLDLTTMKITSVSCA